MEKKLKQCSHPNCRLSATKLHPNSNRGLCDEHHSETISAIKNSHKIITLTCPNNEG